LIFSTSRRKRTSPVTDGATHTRAEALSAAVELSRGRKFA